jgi:hypothetical protein
MYLPIKKHVYAAEYLAAHNSALKDHPKFGFAVLSVNPLSMHFEMLSRGLLNKWLKWMVHGTIIH